ncbi:hypothetical protein J437_LFUL011556 [Ladona fulva]|uniref:Threonylcarbamoyl-AMP synthase n=1 Tax=Ladona fulva TaxID=123851 RepID=A0A8K0KBU9_LADFU|nr:hypothetical protein J437_LFUL011556 [Ladona fulva]
MPLEWLNSTRISSFYKVFNDMAMKLAISKKVTDSVPKRILIVKDNKRHSMSPVISLVKDDTNDISQAVQLAVQLLREGEVIALPTDTVYGIAADAQNSTAINQLYEIKKRSPFKPLAICVSDPRDVGNWCHLDPNMPKNLLQSLLPGPVTLIFKRKSLLNCDLNPGISCVGVRVPDHPFIRSVASSFGSPIALTSANVSSEMATIATDEFSEMWSSLAAVFDGGCLAGKELKTARLGSTVVDLSNAGCFSIIRPGCALQNTVSILREHGLIENK